METGEEFRKAYPLLSQFLVAWFADYDEDDADIVAEYLSVTGVEDVSLLVGEVEDCLRLSHLPSLEISELANRQIEEQGSAAEWLRSIVRMLKE